MKIDEQNLSENRRWKQSNFYVVMCATAVVNIFFFTLRYLRGQEFGLGMYSFLVTEVLLIGAVLYAKRTHQFAQAGLFAAIVFLGHLIALSFFSGPSFVGTVFWFIAMPIISTQMLGRKQAYFVTALVFAATIAFAIWPPVMDPNFLRLRWINLFVLILICPIMLMYLEGNRRKAYDRLKQAVEDVQENHKVMIEEIRINQVLNTNAKVHMAIEKDLIFVAGRINELLKEQPNNKDLHRMANSISRIQETLVLARKLESSNIRFTEYSQGELMVDLKRNPA